MIGKFVNVFFARADALFNVRVRDLPHDVGDSWVLESEDGTVHHVIFFERMSECSPNSEESPSDSPASPVQQLKAKIPQNIMERLEAVQCIVASPCDKEEAQCAWEELDSIIAELLAI